MFGSKRKKSLAAVRSNIQPLISITQHNFGLPAGFWTDYFVIGFFGTLISHHAKVATRGRITGADLGYVLQNGFSIISAMNGTNLAQRFADLAQMNDPDFVKGADNAIRLACFVMNILKNEASYPEIETALRMHAGDRSKASANLFEVWFLMEIERRFSLDE